MCSTDGDTKSPRDLVEGDEVLWPTPTREGTVKYPARVTYCKRIPAGYLARATPIRPWDKRVDLPSLVFGVNEDIELL